MSGAAGLSAAKRRRAGGAPTNQPEPRRTQVPQPSNRRYSQSAYNQYRQQMVNQSQIARENVIPVDRINIPVLLKDLNTRVKKIEQNLDIKKQVIPEETNSKDENNEKYNLLLSEISNIKTMVMNLQAAYVVQNKKMEEYCKCQEDRLNKEDEDLINENLDFKGDTKSSVGKKVDKDLTNEASKEVNVKNNKENQTLEITEKTVNKNLAKEVSKEVNEEINKEKLGKKKDIKSENKVKDKNQLAE
jgi:hypothetical protein